MSANGVSKLDGLTGQGGDVVAGFGRGLTSEGALRFDHTDTL